MGETAEAVRVYRFGAFEADLEARVLRKRGLRLKLQDKPFQILALLLERSGRVVTRKELRERLWSPDTFVCFERSLNTAVNKLRQVLSDSARTPRFIEAVSRRGYSFIAPVEAVEVPVSAPEPDAVAASIAVLPFQNSGGDPETEYLSDGITESLINSLSQLPDVRVIARSTVFRYKGRDPDPQSCGRELNVGAVLAGRVVHLDDMLEIDAELVDVEKGWRLWGAHYRRALADIFAVQEEISQEISSKLRLRLTHEDQRRLAKRYTEDSEAYRDYLRGRYFCSKMTEEGLKKGIAHFQQAIQKDPWYALAYASLADAQGLLLFFSLQPPREMIPRAKEAALKALQIDEGLVEAHTSLASIKKVFDWDWAGAEVEYQRALELNPNHASAHHFYADFLSATGRPQEAMEEIQRAQKLDPLSLVISNEVAWNAYMARDYLRAAEQAENTLEMEPGFSPAFFTLGLALTQMERHEEAIATLHKALELSRGNPASLAGYGCAHALGGRKAEALRSLEELRALATRGYVPPYWLAMVCAALGETDAAFDSLHEAYEGRDVWLVWLKVEPRFDSLRADPRFQDLLRRMNFPQ